MNGTSSGGLSDPSPLFWHLHAVHAMTRVLALHTGTREKRKKRQVETNVQRVTYNGVMGDIQWCHWRSLCM